MNIQIENYEIRPHRHGSFWELWEYKEKSVPNYGIRRGWVSMGIYPTTLGEALEYIYELRLKGTHGDKDLKDAMATAKRLQKELLGIGIRTKEITK